MSLAVLVVDGGLWPGCLEPDEDGVYCCWLDLDAATAEARTELGVNGGAPRAIGSSWPEAGLEMRETYPASSLTEAVKVVVVVVEVAVVVVAGAGRAGDLSGAARDFPFCDELMCTLAPRKLVVNGDYKVDRDMCFGQKVPTASPETTMAGISDLDKDECIEIK